MKPKSFDQRMTLAPRNRVDSPLNAHGSSYFLVLGQCVHRFVAAATRLFSGVPEASTREVSVIRKFRLLRPDSLGGRIRGVRRRVTAQDRADLVPSLTGVQLTLGDAPNIGRCSEGLHETPFTRVSSASTGRCEVDNAVLTARAIAPVNEISDLASLDDRLAARRTGRAARSARTFNGNMTRIHAAYARDPFFGGAAR